MAEFDTDKLHHFAESKAAEIIESWWREFGSWDDYVEGGDLTAEEVRYIQDNWEVKTIVE